MRIEYTSVRELRPHPNNARTHSKKQIRQIAKSITQFGFCNPVLVDDANQIIAGHGRVEAAKLLGIDAVPTVRLSHLSEAERRAYVRAMGSVDFRMARRFRVAFWSPLVARAVVSRGQVRHVFGVFGPGYGDHASRRAFQSRRDGRMHSGTECLVHVEMGRFSVSYAFDFRYAMEFVVAHMGTFSSLDVSIRLP